MNTYRIRVRSDSTTGIQDFEADADNPAGAITAALDQIKPAENVTVECYLYQRDVCRDNTGNFRVLNGEARVV